MMGFVCYDQPHLMPQRIAIGQSDKGVHTGDGDTRAQVNVVVESFRNVPPGTLAPQRRLTDDAMAHTVPSKRQALAG
jgi:hypothetical protein